MTAKRKSLPRRPYEEQIVRRNIRVQPTEYVVTSLSEDDVDSSAWQLRIAWRGENSWAVLWLSYCYDADGGRELEPQPSSRTDEWLATHRFTYDEARQLALREFPKLVVNRQKVVNGKVVPA